MSEVRTLNILIAALGGEGGGVLADWIIAAANRGGYPVQSTSIPGVAQRTGATTYYLELLPLQERALDGARPVFALTPTTGDVDVVVASELVEAGRAIQNGFVTPRRTTLIASTSRVFAIGERMAMADGRFDSERIRVAAKQLAQRAILFDASAVAHAAVVPINAVLFGALIASDVLRLQRAWAEEAIRASGKSVEANLRGLDAGIREASRAHLATEASGPAAARAPALPDDVRARFPAGAHDVIAHGIDRLLDYQGRWYADLYLRRLQSIAARDGADAAMTRETARYLGLWMSYEDVIRVADLKTRAERVARIHKEVRAGKGDIVQVVDFLKPGLDELCSILPARLGRFVLNAARRRGSASRWNVGMHISTTGVAGFTLLRLLASLRWWRPYSMRFKDEQAIIERWLRAILDAAQRDRTLALEIAQCAQLVKGYGDTHARASRNFKLIADTYFQAGTGLHLDAAALAQAIGRARACALADPDGTALDSEIARFKASRSTPCTTQAVLEAAK